MEKWIASRASLHDGAYLKFERNRIGAASDEEVFGYWRADRRAHHQRVRQYFEGSDRFLEFDIELHKESKLINFLAPVFKKPVTELPHKNSGV